MADGLRMRADKSWGYDFLFNGKRYTGDTGFRFTQKSLAKIFVADFKAKLRQAAADILRGIKSDPTISCEELLAEWVKNHTGKHAIRVERDWRLHILPTLGTVEAMKVTTAQVEGLRTNFLNAPSLRNVHLADKIRKNLEWKAKKAGQGDKPIEMPKAKPRTNRSANKLMTHFNLVYTWALDTDRIPRRPYKPLEPLIEQDPVRTFLRQDQVAPYLQAVDSRGHLQQMVAIRAMLYLLLREDEALNMRWAGYSEGYTTYSPIDTKTGKATPIAVPQDLRALLVRLRAQVSTDCPLVLPGQHDSESQIWLPHTAQFTTKAIKRAGLNLGVTGLHPHRMRGSMATMMARSGASAFVLKKAGRWQRITTAEKYVEIVEDDVAAAQAKALGLEPPKKV